MNITIDDTSPQIGYYSADGTSSGKWTTNHGGDTYQNNYYRSSFHATPEDSDYMTFSFNGTAVYVYGAKRPNHGYYSASIDGQSGSGLLYGGVGTGGTGEYFEQLLFFSENLSPQKTHTVTLTNAANLTTPLPTAQSPYYLDIDYIIVTTAETGKIYTTIYDDASPAISYHEMNATTNTYYYNQTNHLTYNKSAGFEFSFNGTLVQLLGGVNFDHGNYSVVLDGGLNQVFSGYSYNFFPNSSLFLASNLTQGLHTVSVTNLGDPSGGNTLDAFDFDWAIVQSTIDPNLGPVNSTNTTTTSNTTMPDTGQTTHTTHTVPIVVGVVVGVVGLAFIAFVLWFFVFRRRKRYQKAQTYDPTMDLNAEPQENGPGHHYLDGREVAPYRSLSQGGGTSNQLHSTMSGTGTAAGMGVMSEVGHNQPSFAQPGTDSSYGSVSGGTGNDRGGSSGYLNFPAAPPSNATSYPASESAFSPVTQGRAPGSQTFPQASPHTTGLPLGAAASSYAASSSGGGTTTDHSGSGSDRPLPPVAAGTGFAHPPSSPPPPSVATSPPSGGHPGSLKSATVSLPYTARPPTSPPIRDERINLPGREVDMGPMIHHEGREDEEMLPPDYHQATQPLPGQRPDPDP